MAKEPELPVGFEDLRGEEFKERYAVEQLVGASSRRVMFTGVDRQTDQPVVVRLSRPWRQHDEATLDRFERRMAACARVDHPTIERPIDSGELFDGNLYIVSPRPPGEPLDRFLAARPRPRLEWKEACPLLLMLVQGLGAAHARRLVHGSLNPTCCWIHHADERLHLRLLDLGMNANSPTEDADLASSRTTTFGDDAVFMAPETVGGILGDERTDLYLTGLLAYFMLVGQPPFRGRNAFQLVAKHLQAPVPKLEAAGVEVPEGVEALVARLLAKQPDERPASMDEVEAVLLGLGEDDESPPRLAGLEPQPKPRGRGRGRAKRAGGPSREEALQRLGAGRRGGGRQGRRLPGQEILDPGRGAGDLGKIPQAGHARAGRSMSAPSSAGPLGIGPPMGASAGPMVRPPEMGASVGPMVGSPEMSVSAGPMSRPAVRQPEPPVPEPELAPPPELDAMATATFCRAEVEAFQAGARPPVGVEQAAAWSPTPPGAGHVVPDATMALDPSIVRGGKMGTERTEALSLSQLERAESGPERTVMLSPSPSPPATGGLGPERTVALSRSQMGMDEGGPARTEAFALPRLEEGRGGLESTVALRIDGGSDPDPGGPASTAVFDHSAFGGTSRRRPRGGARVVASPDDEPRSVSGRGSEGAWGSGDPYPSAGSPGPMMEPPGMRPAVSPPGPGAPFLQGASGSNPALMTPQPMSGASHAPSMPFEVEASEPLTVEPPRLRVELWIGLVAVAVGLGVTVGLVLGAG